MSSRSWQSAAELDWDNHPDDEGNFAREICNVCGADIPADDNCWYCENQSGKITKPVLLLVKSYVAICAGCHSWYARAPQWYGTGDKGDQCYKCGSTSFEIREGRPYGPRCKEWAQLAEEFYDMYDILGSDELLMLGVKIERT